MPERPLTSRSALAAVARSGAGHTHGAVTIAECMGFQLVHALIRKGCAERFAGQIRTHFNVELPPSPRRIVGAHATFIWAGGGQWLIMAGEDAGTTWCASLSALLADTAALSPQTDGRVIVRLSGPCARDALAKLCSIDLHPEIFTPESAALTRMGHFPVHLWRSGPTDVYELAVQRSYAESFWRTLLEAAAEYGCEIAPQCRIDGGRGDSARQRSFTATADRHAL